MWNRCIASFSPDATIRFCQEALEVHKHRKHGVHVVSVGSGRAVLESALHSTNDKKQCELHFHCVDPAPTSFGPVNGKVEIAPEADYVLSLIKKAPWLVNNCLVLLNWPEPTAKEYCNKGWDLEAILLLRPMGVLLLVEFIKDEIGVCGGAGSAMLNEWLVHQKQYDMRARWTLQDRLHQSIYEFCPSLMWLYRKDLYPSKPCAERNAPDNSKYLLSDFIDRKD